MPVATPIARIELSRDRWVRLHLPSVNQQLDIIELPTFDTEEGSRTRVRFWRDTFAENQVETSWGGDVMDGITVRELEMFATLWLTAAEEDAVPLGLASGGATPPPKLPSEAPTGSPSKSRRRRSSQS